MDERLKPYEERMQKSYDYLEADLATIRAGRANPHVLDKLRVDYYGTPTPIQQVGNVTVPEPRIIQIAPWEKTLIKAIEKAFPFFIRYLAHLHFQCYTKSPPYPPTPTPLPTHSPFLALAFPCTGAYKVCVSNGPLFPVMAD